MNRTVGSLELIKRINRQLVLDKIKEEQPISRARIVGVTMMCNKSKK